MPNTGANWNIWPSSYTLGKVPFNAVTDVVLSDSIPTAGGGTAQVKNYTVQGATFQSNDLIGAVIFLLFLDGVNFAQVSVTDPTQKEFSFDSTTGIVTFSYNIDDPVLETIFFASAGSAIVPPTEPVSVADFKLYAKLDTGTLDDTIIAELITTSREQCEDYTGVSIITRSVTATLNNSNGGIYLPYCPFISLTSIVDCDGNAILPANYKLSNQFGTGYFPQLLWPCDRQVTLVYTAGYGVPPAKFITAIKQQTFFLYENRGDDPLIYRGVEAAITLSPQALATLQRLRRV
jgi:uncharacterized phiE125 gp8 family phage protein